MTGTLGAAMVIPLYASALVALVLALTGSLAAATVVAGVVRLVPTQDTTIYSESGDLGNGAGEFVFSGRTSSSLIRLCWYFEGITFCVQRGRPSGSFHDKCR